MKNLIHRRRRRRRRERTRTSKVGGFSFYLAVPVQVL